MSGPGTNEKSLFDDCVNNGEIKPGDYISVERDRPHTNETEGTHHDGQLYVYLGDGQYEEVGGHVHIPEE